MSDFIELTNAYNHNKFMLNIKRIKTVVPENDMANIYTDDAIFTVYENYDEIKKKIMECEAVLEDDLK